MDLFDVRQILGPSLKEVPSYREHAVSPPTVDFSGIVVAVNASVVPALRVVQSGMSKSEVLAHVGPPESISLIYPRTPHDRSYRMRAVLIKNCRVVEKSAEFYVD